MQESVENLRVLRLWALGKQRPSFGRGARLSLFAPDAHASSEPGRSPTRSRNQPCEKCVHLLAQPQAHEPKPHHNGDMNDSKDRKSIAEGPMNHMPKVKDLLRLIRERQHAWRAKPFAAPDEPLVQPLYFRWKAVRQSTGSCAPKPHDERRRPAIRKGSPASSTIISPTASRGPMRRICSAEGISQRPVQLLCGIDRLPDSASASSRSLICNSVKRKFGSVQRARNLRVEIAPDDPA